MFIGTPLKEKKNKTNQQTSKQKNQQLFTWCTNSLKLLWQLINYKPKKKHNHKVTFKQSMNIKKGTTGKKLTKHNKKIKKTLICDSFFIVTIEFKRFPLEEEQFWLDCMYMSLGCQKGLIHYILWLFY